MKLCAVVGLVPLVAAAGGNVAVGTAAHSFRDGVATSRPDARYQLAEDAVFDLRQDGFPDFTHDEFRLVDGVLYIDAGFAWNGASGPAIDTPSFMRASLVHDVLYQAIREGLLKRSCRSRADKVLLRYCKADGMNWIRRKYVYRIVRWLAPPSDWFRRIRAYARGPRSAPVIREPIPVFPIDGEDQTEELRWLSEMRAQSE